MALEVVFDVSGCFAGMRCGLIRCTVSSALGNETIKRDLAVFLFSHVSSLGSAKSQKCVPCSVLNLLD